MGYILRKQNNTLFRVNFFLFEKIVYLPDCSEIGYTRFDERVYTLMISEINLLHFYYLLVFNRDIPLQDKKRICFSGPKLPVTKFVFFDFPIRTLFFFKSLIVFLVFLTLTALIDFVWS